MKNRIRTCMTLAAAVALAVSGYPYASLTGSHVFAEEKDTSAKEVTLRVCNWEEYIDEGGWNADETIDLESTDIRGDNSMVDDFVQWYYKTYGKKVNVEYICLGTNEEL